MHGQTLCTKGDGSLVDITIVALPLAARGDGGGTQQSAGSGVLRLRR